MTNGLIITLVIILVVGIYALAIWGWAWLFHYLFLAIKTGGIGWGASYVLAIIWTTLLSALHRNQIQ